MLAFSSLRKGNVYCFLWMPRIDHSKPHRTLLNQKDRMEEAGKVQRGTKDSADFNSVHVRFDVKKNKIKVITQWGGGIGKQIKKLSLFLYHVIAFQKEFSSESLGNVRRTQLLLTRAATRKGDSSVEKREMDGFSPGRQGWRGHLSNYRSLTTLLYNLVSLFPGWSEILCYKLPIVAKCELILGSFSTTVNICLF